MPLISRFSRKTRDSFNAAAKKIADAMREVGNEVSPTLLAVGEEIMTDVKASRPGHGVPVDKGTLRGSGRVTGPAGHRFRPFVTLSFGGAAAPYALIQHEVVTFKHTVGEPRYLVRGMERWKPGGSPAWLALQKNAKAALNRERKP